MIKLPYSLDSQEILVYCQGADIIFEALVAVCCQDELEIPKNFHLTGKSWNKEDEKQIRKLLDPDFIDEDSQFMTKKEFREEMDRVFDNFHDFIKKIRENKGIKNE